MKIFYSPSNSRQSDYYTPGQVCKKLGVSYPTLAAIARRPDFPTPINLGPRTKRYRAAEIDRFIDANGFAPAE